MRNMLNKVILPVIMETFPKISRNRIWKDLGYLMLIIIKSWFEFTELA